MKESFIILNVWQIPYHELVPHKEALCAESCLVHEGVGKPNVGSKVIAEALIQKVWKQIL